MSRVLVAGALAGALCIVPVRPTGAQSTPGAAPPAAEDSVAPTQFGWLGRGFVGGLATPLGAWWVYRRAARSAVALPDAVRDSGSERRASYERSIRDGRKEYALVGGFLGSVVLGVVVIRAAHLGGTASTQGEAPAGTGLVRIAF